MKKNFSPIIVIFLFLSIFYSPAFSETQNDKYNDEPVRGLIRALNDAWVSTELNARIIKILKREGESFKKGDILVSFDCLQFTERLNSAKSDRDFEKISLENAKHLDKHKAIGRFEIEQARVKFEKAKSEVAILEAHMRDCDIVAPFEGRVAELEAHVFETPNPGKPFLRIVGTENIEAELIVPSHFLQWLKSGIEFKLRIDEIGTKHDAKVERVGVIVDSSSQTIKLIAVFKKNTPEMLPGMSLTAEFARLAD